MILGCREIQVGSYFNYIQKYKWKYPGNAKIMKHRLLEAPHHENMPICVDPLKPHFYIVKLRFTGVYIIFFLFLLKKHRLWVLVTTASQRQFLQVPTICFEQKCEAVLIGTHNLCFEQKYENISFFFYLKVFSFWSWNFLYIPYFNRNYNKIGMFS